jgi:Delta7-sterol 5-desaturase
MVFHFKEGVKNFTALALIYLNAAVYLFLGLFLLYGDSLNGHIQYFQQISFGQLFWSNLLDVGGRILFYFVGTCFIAYLLYRLYRKSGAIGQRLGFGMPQIRREIIYSALAFLVNASFLIVVTTLWHHGVIVYDDGVGDYGIIYLLFTILLGLFIYDTNFYFWHRLLHIPYLFRKIHKVHHKSVDISVLTSLSVHPVEAALLSLGSFIYLVFVPLIIPISYYSVFFVLIITYGHIVYVHSGYELLPKGVARWIPFKYLNTSSHHNAHHKKRIYNFSILFNVWDRVFHTETVDATQAFLENSSKIWHEAPAERLVEKEAPDRSKVLQ